MYRIVGGRTPSEQRVAIGANAGGHFIAIVHTGTVAMLDVDPIELRLRYADGGPSSGLPFSSREIERAWRDGADKFDWDKRTATPGAVRDGEWLVGMGRATGKRVRERSITLDKLP